jgi:predicted nuclease with TOPRIM domain
VTDTPERDALIASNDALQDALAEHSKLLNSAHAKIELLNEKLDLLSDDMDRLRTKLPDN